MTTPEILIYAVDGIVSHVALIPDDLAIVTIQMETAETVTYYHTRIPAVEAQDWPVGASHATTLTSEFTSVERVVKPL